MVSCGLPGTSTSSSTTLTLLTPRSAARGSLRRAIRGGTSTSTTSSRWSQPNIPVLVELHHAPKWIDGSSHRRPRSCSRWQSRDRSRGGVRTLTREAHAVVLAVHSWAHQPLGSLRDLIDVAALIDDADVDQIERLARRWGVSDVWRATYGAVEALFGSGRRPLTMRVWARHLEAVRGRTVAESHLERWLSPFWALPWRTALQRTSRRIADELRPVPGETWRTKVSRARLAVRNAEYADPRTSGCSRSLASRRLRRSCSTARSDRRGGDTWSQSRDNSEGESK